MMPLELTEEQLNLVCQCSQALMRPYETAVLLDLDRDQTEEFLANIRACSRQPYVTAWLKGRAQTQLQLHESVVRLALKGSPAAQPIAEQYLKDQLI